MAYATYTFFEGELVTVMHEGRRRDVATDPQGSVVHLMTSFFVLSDSLTYWPYGEQRTKSGGINIPFHYAGAHGYYEDTSNRLYVRARYYRADLGNWITKDPLWPEEPAYAYVRGNPTNHIDPSGMAKKCTDIYGSLINVSLPICRLKVKAPIGLPWPPTDKRRDDFRCWTEALQSDVPLCVSTMQSIMAALQVELQAANTIQYDKYIHCIIGCMGTRIYGAKYKGKGPLCGILLATYLEVKLPSLKKNTNNEKIIWKCIIC